MKYSPAPLTPSFATLPQNPPRLFRYHSPVSYAAQTLNTYASIACALLNSLAALFATPILCFQSLAASFAKYRGVGCPGTQTMASMWPYLRFHESPLTKDQSLLFAPRLFSRTYKSLLSHHRSACAAFSNTYRSLFAQTLSFHINTNRRGCHPHFFTSSLQDARAASR